MTVRASFRGQKRGGRKREREQVLTGLNDEIQWKCLRVSIFERKSGDFGRKSRRSELKR